MNLMIKRMSPELADDYFDFFDNRAFSDDSPNYPCYCNAFNMSAERIRSEIIDQVNANGGGAEGWKRSLRKSAQSMIERSEIQGYLAYDNEISVGWCNANDKGSYYRFGEFNLDTLPLDEENVKTSSTDRIKSVVCFEIAPEYRGKGLATALLERVCEDALQDGYKYVEAYPAIREKEEELDFTGPVRLYEKLGFTLFEQHGKMLVMRKQLK
ncbi:MAG: GNAT family N-acetyltransferase [Lachnospiraceae bacterium]|nr:GNAT family N-acetyltransferase [Lachnospiraceae bacterium]